MMDYSDIKTALTDVPRLKDTSFAILREIARHVNQSSTHNQGRDLVIRALSVMDQFVESEREILMSLVRSVGLFPYMTEYVGKSNFDDYLAYELHRAEHLEGDVVFHSLQARIFNELIAGTNVVLSASTSVGKSLIIDALVASGKYEKIVVVVPTIALIDEIRRRLLHRFKERCAIITHPTQQSHPKRVNIYVLTQERVLHREDLNDTDLFIVDEFYKVNLGGESESDRAIDLNLAFNKLARTGAQFYLLGPNIQTIHGLEPYEYHFIPSEFSTVAVDVMNFNLSTRGDDRMNKLVELCKSLEGPTIVYCQSPRSANTVALELASKCEFGENPHTASATEWIAEEYHREWSVCRALSSGIGVHHGGVPRALQQYFIRLFNARKIRFLVCTSTIIEGVNTVAKNVIIYDRRRSKNLLDHFTYKNIEGRAGRMNEYFIGHVYVLESPPEDESFAVEFPIGKQTSKTPFGLLLELDKDELTPASRDRLDWLFQTSSLTAETLRQNRHAPLPAQEEIATAIRQNLGDYRPTLAWSGIPNAAQLASVCELIFQHLERHALLDYGISSGEALAWHLNSLRMNRTLSGYLKQAIESRWSDQTVSDAIDMALRFVRNIACHQFPRDLMVIGAIQRQIFNEHGMHPGDYTLFAGQVENLFMPSALFALDEYGIPIQTAQRLASRLTPAETLDEVLLRLARLQLDTLKLTDFEREILQDVQRSS